MSGYKGKKRPGWETVLWACFWLSLGLFLAYLLLSAVPKHIAAGLETGRSEPTAWEDQERAEAVYTERIAVHEPAETEEEPEEPAAFWPLSDEERDLIERVVAAESVGEPLEGQMAVAQCILNTAIAEGLTPTEVVLEKNQYASPMPPDRVTDSVREAVAAVFDLGETAVDAPIRFFYNPDRGTSSWHETALAYVTTIGGHRFFMTKDETHRAEGEEQYR